MLWAYIEADFQREYAIDLVHSEMSWRKFRVLYSGLSAKSQVYLNYDRIAKKAGVKNSSAEQSAWEAFAGLAKPTGKKR